jgi:hypothetical protein
MFMKLNNHVTAQSLLTVLGQVEEEAVKDFALFWVARSRVEEVRVSLLLQLKIANCSFSLTIFFLLCFCSYSLFVYFVNLIRIVPIG